MGRLPRTIESDSSCREGHLPRDVMPDIVAGAADQRRTRRRQAAPHRTGAAPPAYEKQQSHASVPPPTYHNAQDLPDDFNDHLINGFAKLNLDSPEGLTRSQTIAHLKTLECFYRLRKRIASTNGLFGITNSNAESLLRQNNCSSSDDVLAVFGEKKWGVYVARAVDRFERWRDAVAPATKLVTIDQFDKSTGLGATFSDRASHGRLVLTPACLPPVGESSNISRQFSL